MIQSALFSLGFLLITSCAHQSASVISTGTEGKALLRFQNMLALEVAASGCSFLDYGGIDRWCAYNQANPTAFEFQIGPAFSRVISPPSSATPASDDRQRNIIWSEWKKNGVRFYAVSPLDFKPSLQHFESVSAENGIVKLSTNLLSKGDSRPLYKTVIVSQVGQRQIAFLNFAPPTLQGTDWKVESFQKSMADAEAQIPSTIDTLVILGHLNKGQRAELATFTARTIFYLGGGAMETNTTKIVKEGPRLWHAKSPALGHGVAELSLNLSGQAQADLETQVGSLSAAYKVRIFDSKTKVEGRCAKILTGDFVRTNAPCESAVKLGRGGPPCPDHQ